MQKKYVGAIDQGTTSTRFMLFDKNGNIISFSQKEHKQIYPKAGWVEHNPLTIWENTNFVIKDALYKQSILATDIAAIGITNQRETTIVWNPKTGKPYYNAIVWQDIRTASICELIKQDINEASIREKTGLPIATYFSATKIKWILDNNRDLRKLATKGEVLFGTIDSWIIWWITGGPNKGNHITDVTNASRTLLFSLETMQWDDELLKTFDIPREILPQIRASSDNTLYGYTTKDGPFQSKIPVSGALGDQQAALFGQMCFNKGDAKNTYGTGGFLLMNTGETPIHSKYGLITTLGYKINNDQPIYALEGSVAIAGALVQWLRDNIGIITKSSEIEELANKVDSNGGVYFVPAFSGLFAPYWIDNARGTIIGLTRYVTKNHIARAALEATAFQTKEIYDAMVKDSNITIPELKVDGGMVVNNFLMQFQADILNMPVIRPDIIETTVLGAAYAAGLAVGFWKNVDELKQNQQISKKWQPNMSNEKRDKEYSFWLKAVKRTFDWL